MHYAISGKIASGKDTAAKLFIEYLRQQGRQPRMLRFADRLYQLCAAYDQTAIWNEDGWVPTEQTTFDYKQWVSASFVTELVRQGILANYSSELCEALSRAAQEHPTIPGQKNRARMQIIAEDILRAQVDRDLWIKLIQAEYERLAPAHTLIFTDFRYKNEACWFEARNITRLRIDVDPHVQKQRMLTMNMEYTPARLQHISETDLDDYRHFTDRFANNGSLEELERKVASWVALSFSVQAGG